MRTEDITTVTHYRKNLRDCLNKIKDTGRPMFITNQSGDTEAVMISSEAFDRMMEKIELADSLSRIDRSMEEIKAERTHDAKQAIRAIANELGLTLKQ